MDTDIAEEICDIGDRFSEYNQTRRSYCQKAVLSWLGETPETLDGAYLLLPSYAIETWILASHDPTETVFDDLKKPFNYEELPDFEHRLISLGYPSKNIRGKRRLKKQGSRYKRKMY